MSLLMGAGAQAAQVLDGRWGGDRLQLVFDSGTGRIEMDCASGVIAGPVTLTEAGKFDATGTFKQHQGGPQRADEPAKPDAVRYSGEVTRDVMRLTILPADASAARTFTLRKGEAVKLVRCL